MLKDYRREEYNVFLNKFNSNDANNKYSDIRKTLHNGNLSYFLIDLDKYLMKIGHDFRVPLSYYGIGCIGTGRHLQSSLFGSLSYPEKAGKIIQDTRLDRDDAKKNGQVQLVFVVGDLFYDCGPQSFMKHLYKVEKNQPFDPKIIPEFKKCFLDMFVKGYEKENLAFLIQEGNHEYNYWVHPYGRSGLDKNNLAGPELAIQPTILAYKNLLNYNQYMWFMPYRYYFMVSEHYSTAFFILDSNTILWDEIQIKLFYLHYDHCKDKYKNLVCIMHHPLNSFGRRTSILGKGDKIIEKYTKYLNGASAGFPIKNNTEIGEQINEFIFKPAHIKFTVIICAHDHFYHLWQSEYGLVQCTTGALAWEKKMPLDSDYYPLEKPKKMKEFKKRTYDNRNETVKSFLFESMVLEKAVQSKVEHPFGVSSPYNELLTYENLLKYNEKMNNDEYIVRDTKKIQEKFFSLENSRQKLIDEYIQKYKKTIQPEKFDKKKQELITELLKKDDEYKAIEENESKEKQELEKKYGSGIGHWYRRKIIRDSEEWLMQKHEGKHTALTIKINEQKKEVREKISKQISDHKVVMELFLEENKEQFEIKTSVEKTNEESVKNSRIRTADSSNDVCIARFVIERQELKDGSFIYPSYMLTQNVENGKYINNSSQLIDPKKMNYLTDGFPLPLTPRPTTIIFPKTEHFDIPEGAVAQTKQKQDLKQKIYNRILQSLPYLDNYDVVFDKSSNKYKLKSFKTKEEINDKVYDLSKISTKVEDIFSPDGIAQLFKDTHKEKNFPDNQKKRKKFLLLLAERMKKFDINKYSKLIADKKPITIREFLGGGDNLKLYAEALEEENKSVEFRKAVAIKSTTFFTDMQWGKQVHFIVGGPSAAGKSFNTNLIILKLIQDNTLNELNSTEKIKKVVTSDGGIERDVSQIRKMALQCALALGFVGIESLDLDGIDKLSKPKGSKKIKSYIKKAALASPNKVHLVQPLTFADSLLVIGSTHIGSSYLSELKDELKKKDKNMVFAMVVPDKTAVTRNGNSRAWYKGAAPSPEDIDINKDKIACESKAYHDHYKRGVDGSIEALKIYIRYTKKPICVALTNRLLFMKNSDGNAEISNNPNDVGTFMVSEDTFLEWNKKKEQKLDQYIKNNLPSMKVAIGKEQIENIIPSMSHAD